VRINSRRTPHLLSWSRTEPFILHPTVFARELA
jgi:hypothetical protein